VVPGVDPELARAALALLPEDGRADVLVLATGPIGEASRAAARRTEGPHPHALERLAGAMPGDLRRLGFFASDADRAARAARAPELAAALAAAERPSAIAAAARGWPLEAVALAGALGAAGAARAWLEDLRHVALEITGDDLLAAGVAQGPEVGERLARALARRLDGELPPGREAELEAALGG
jgi:hypothetical protein